MYVYMYLLNEQRESTYIYTMMWKNTCESGFISNKRVIDIISNFHVL